MSSCQGSVRGASRRGVPVRFAASKIARSAASVAANSTGATSCDTCDGDYRLQAGRLQRPARHALMARDDRIPRSRCRRPCACLRRRDAWARTACRSARWIAPTCSPPGRQCALRLALTQRPGSHEHGLGSRQKSTSCTWPRNDRKAKPRVVGMPCTNTGSRVGIEERSPTCCARLRDPARRASR